MRRIIQVTEADSGKRIDKLLSQQLPELTRSAIQHLMQDGCVTIGEQPVKKKCESSCRRRDCSRCAGAQRGFHRTGKYSARYCI